ncbi:MAG: HAD-IIA family hydrolase [Oscillospiraceae bacterium]|nr:HAD-IIA family hydrolase [Oscillospiraceae bacterium]
MNDYTALRSCELFLFDMDGTLYLGDEVYDGAIALMEDLPRLGKKYIYLTNNSSRAGEDYIHRLRRLGFPCEAENVFTSGMATGQYLNQHHPGAKVYLAGTRAFYRELTSYGIDLVNDELGHTEAEDVDVVVQGFDTELVYEKLDRAVHYLRRGAAFIAANPDWVCPMPRGEVLPDCGSICALLKASSGREPTFIGKPNRNMIDVIAAMTGIPNEKICAVGDRIYTDIAVAQNAGSVSVLVMSGETDEAILAAAERKPDYVLPSVKELHEVLRS